MRIRVVASFEKAKVLMGQIENLGISQVGVSFKLDVPIVVPKIANPRNHQEAHTEANTQRFIYKLELVSEYTRHSGAGTWTPRWVLA